MTKIAAIQFCSTDNVENNLEVANKLIQEAAQNNAKLIVLPEAFACMGIEAADKIHIKEKYGHGKIQSFLSHAALQHKVWILGGTIPLESSDGNKIRAASLLYDDKGKVVARYDKIHLFDVDLPNNESYRESDTTEAGNELVVVDTPFGKLGLGVCYDIRFPEMFRYLFNHGAEIIILPSAFTVRTGKAHWEILTRSRAIENFCYLIGAAQGGTHTNNRKTYGHSLIVSPWGDILSKSNGDNAEIIYADIDLESLREIRKSIPIAAHQKIFIDTSTLERALLRSKS